MLDIAAAARLWSLGDIVQIADTPGSNVYRARTGAGAQVVVKLLKPRGIEELAGMDYLAWREGHGAVGLLARQDNACLLQDAGPITLEDHRLTAGEDAAIEVFANVLAALHAPSVHRPPGGLTPLTHHFRALTERGAPAHPEHADDLIWAADIARSLLARQTQPMPLHGDLHHENILSLDGHEWRAIDPHGLFGDPVYDVANFFGNPIGRPDITCDSDRILRIVRTTAPALQCSTEKLLHYAAAHAALSACWSIDDPVSEEDFQDALDRLAFLKVARNLAAYEQFR